jgi:hypothetical protein
MARTCVPSMSQLGGASGSVIVGTDFSGMWPMCNNLKAISGLFLLVHHEN